MQKYVQINADNSVNYNIDDNMDSKTAVSLGLSAEKQEVELGYDGNYYLLGHAPAQDLNELKSQKLTEINNIYEQKASLVKIDTPESEVSTWYIQENEATEWSKDNTKTTPFIDGLATARQMDRLVLIGKVLGKVANYKTYMSNLTGQRQFYEDLIKSAETSEELEQITWN